MKIMVGTNSQLHDAMTKGIMSAPIQFFETNNPGVIMNRFSKDLGQVDEMLPQVMSDAIKFLITCILILVIAGYTNYYTIFMSIPLLYIFMRIRVYYIKVNLDVSDTVFTRFCQNLICYLPDCKTAEAVRRSHAVSSCRHVKLDHQRTSGYSCVWCRVKDAR